MSPDNDCRRRTLRRLAAAVLLRAMADAQAGEVSAAHWLLGDGVELAGALGIEQAQLEAWCRTFTPPRPRNLRKRFPPYPTTPLPEGGNES